MHVGLSERWREVVKAIRRRMTWWIVEERRGLCPFELQPASRSPNILHLLGTPSVSTAKSCRQ